MADSHHELRERGEVARAVLDGLREGFHFAVLRHEEIGGDRVPVTVVWNYDRPVDIRSRNDDFTDPDLSERHRELAIEHQEQYQDDETEQAELTEAVA